MVKEILYVIDSYSIQKRFVLKALAKVISTTIFKKHRNELSDVAALNIQHFDHIDKSEQKCSRYVKIPIACLKSDDFIFTKGYEPYTKRNKYVPVRKYLVRDAFDNGTIAVVDVPDNHIIPAHAEVKVLQNTQTIDAFFNCFRVTDIYIGTIVIDRDSLEKYKVIGAGHNNYINIGSITSGEILSISCSDRRYLIVGASYYINKNNKWEIYNG